MGTTGTAIRSPEHLTSADVVQIWMPSKHMGNLLMSLRTIEALLSYYARCRRVLIIDESYRDLVNAAHFPAEIIFFPRKDIDRAALPGKVFRGLSFISNIRKHRPTLAIAVEGDKVSQRFLPLSGCEHSAGPDNRYCKGFKTRLPVPTEKHHIFFDYEAVARGITGQALEPGYVPLEASAPAKNRIAHLLTQELANPERPYAILHPCATKDYKQWPVAHFAKVVEHLHHRGLNTVITGAGEFDRQTIEQLAGLTGAPILSLLNRLTLDEFIALMEKARFFMGNDTGPTHLAASCGIPTFALFGPTDESLWGPLGDNVTILRSAVPCEPDCLRRQCSVDYRCMSTLAPDIVCARLDGLP